MVSSHSPIDALTELQEARKYCYIRKTKKTQTFEIDVDVRLTNLQTNEVILEKALIDCGATFCAIDDDFVTKHGLQTELMARPQPVYNSDGSKNALTITKTCTLRMEIDGHEEMITFCVTKLSKHNIFIRYNWLQKHNPTIDWSTNELSFNRCPSDCNIQQHIIRHMDVGHSLGLDDIEFPESDDGDLEAHLRRGDKVYAAYPSKNFLRAYGTKSTELAAEAEAKKEKKHWTEIVSPHYHDFVDVFTKEDFENTPEPRIWDHAIELKPGAKPTDCKIYPLSPSEQKELDAFLEENLRSGRIQSSKSPMASPFFFVKKKDGKLRPVQDY